MSAIDMYTVFILFFIYCYILYIGCSCHCGYHPTLRFYYIYSLQSEADYCFDLNLNQNENEAFSAVFSPGGGKDSPGGARWLFLDLPLHDGREVLDLCPFLTEQLSDS